MTEDILSDISWHSSFGINADSVTGKKLVKKASKVKATKEKFLRVGEENDYLIHRATKALWRFSEDGEHIEPVFEEDVLTEDEF